MSTATKIGRAMASLDRAYNAADEGAEQAMYGLYSSLIFCDPENPVEACLVLRGALDAARVAEAWVQDNPNVPNPALCTMEQLEGAILRALSVLEPAHGMKLEDFAGSYAIPPRYGRKKGGEA